MQMTLNIPEEPLCWWKSCVVMWVAAPSSAPSSGGTELAWRAWEEERSCVSWLQTPSVGAGTARAASLACSCSLPVPQAWLCTSTVCCSSSRIFPASLGAAQPYLRPHAPAEPAFSLPSLRSLPLPASWPLQVLFCLPGPAALNFWVSALASSLKNY